MWIACGLVAAAVVAAGILALLLHRAEPYVRACILQELQDRFHARVELDSFHMSLLDGLRAEGKGLRIWPPSQTQEVSPAGTAGLVEPLIQLEEFSFHAPLRYTPGKPFHISLVELKGLDIHVPPRTHFGYAAAGSGYGKSGVALLWFDVDTMECNGARLVMEPSTPGKLPLEFAIAHFKLTNIASAKQMGFDAELTNPRPVGTIHSTGSFGPWVTEDPGGTPVTGVYRFDHADLATFKGIAGILNSTGRYTGTLRDLSVDGEADVPDFRLTHFGHAMVLDTRFHARVNGTNGDTWLEPVDATLGQSHFTAQGQIVRVIAAEAGEPPHSIGHDIALTVNVDRARIGDFLALASPPERTTPLLIGAVTMKTTLHIPPGKEPIHQRMRLKGQFVLDQAHFTNEMIQKRIEQLSLRGQGRPKDMKKTNPESIGSAMQGDFQIANGVVTLPNLIYTVPGATIDLKGTYGLDGGTLNFTGTVKLQATVSQMVGGWVGALLKPADRFFRKDGAGTEVPIHVEGTREHPTFGIGFGGKK